LVFQFRFNLYSSQWWIKRAAGLLVLETQTFRHDIGAIGMATMHPWPLIITCDQFWHFCHYVLRDCSPFQKHAVALPHKVASYRWNWTLDSRW